MPKKQPKRKPETWWCIQDGRGGLVPGTNSRNRRDAILLFVSQGDEYSKPTDVEVELWNYYSKHRGYRVVRIEVRRVESK